MLFFKKYRKSIKLKGISLVTTVIASKYDDKKSIGPRCVNYYYLAKCKRGKYYELFSGVELEKESDTHYDEFVFKKLDKPYVEQAEPIQEYLKNPYKRKLDTQSLVEFITMMNVWASLETSTDKSMQDETDN